MKELSSMLNILIVEDDLFIAEMLKEMLLELDYQVVGIAKNYDQAMHLLQTTASIDLCFVDINLEDQKSGFDVAPVIREAYRIPFVFLTSYSDKKTIEDAASHHPEAYLVKPFTKVDLLTTVEIIRTRQRKAKTQEEPQTIVIKDGSLNVKVNIEDIRWLKSDNIYVEVKTPNKTFLVRSSLESFIDELGSDSFFRTHRSFAVNMNHVSAVNGQYLIIGAEKIPLSRKFRDEIVAHFKS